MRKDNKTNGMFRKQETTFGPFRKHIFRDEASGSQLVVAPDRGACLLSLTVGETELLDAYTTHQELDFDRWAKNMPLFPFPNRLDGGRYEWQGETYQFDLSDEMTGNAIHGFASDQAFELVVSDLRVTAARVQYRLVCDGSREAYPFPCTFTNEMTLTANGQFTMALACTNNGAGPMPVGFGFHPYFRLGDQTDHYELQLPPSEMIGLDNRMLPTGKRYAFDDFASIRPLRSTVLDNCFAPTETGDRLSAILAGAKGKMNYWQETGPGKFNFIQVFTPPYRTSLAIEPMSCNVNAFNNGEGLITLAPRQTATARWGFSFSPPAGS